MLARWIEAKVWCSRHQVAGSGTLLLPSVWLHELCCICNCQQAFWMLSVGSIVPFARDMLVKVWEKTEHEIDVCHVTRVAHADWP